MLSELRLVINLKFDFIALKLICFLSSADYESKGLLVICHSRLILVLTVLEIFDLLNCLELIDFVEPLVLEVVNALIEETGVEVIMAHLIRL